MNTTTEAKNARLQMATTIMQQIGVMNRMACGARQAVAIDNGVMFRVSTRKPRTLTKIIVELTPMDLYHVRLVKIDRKTGSASMLEEHNGVYAESLGNTVYHMVNK